MSHSEQTLHYGLPKYIGTDIINPLKDFNDANDAIDEALYNANMASAHAESVAEDAVVEVGSYDERITQAQTSASGAIILSNNVKNMMAEEFNPVKIGGYRKGEIVIFGDKLYEFINAHMGAWDASDVKVVTVSSAIDDLVSTALDNKYVMGGTVNEEFTQGDNLEYIANWLATLWTSKDANVVDIVVDDIVIKGTNADTVYNAGWSYVNTNFLNKLVSANHISVSADGISIDSIGTRYDIVSESLVWFDSNASITNLGVGGALDAFALSDNGTSVTGQRYASPLSYGGNEVSTFRADAVVHYHYVYSI